jgi:hypothetical protein
MMGRKVDDTDVAGKKDPLDPFLVLKKIKLEPFLVKHSASLDKASYSPSSPLPCEGGSASILLSTTPHLTRVLLAQIDLVRLLISCTFVSRRGFSAFVV